MEIFHGINFRPCGKDHHRHYVIINMGQIKSTTAGGKKGKYFLQVKISRQKFQPFRIRQKVEAVLSYPCWMRTLTWMRKLIKVLFTLIVTIFVNILVLVGIENWLRISLYIEVTRESSCWFNVMYYRVYYQIQTFFTKHSITFRHNDDLQWWSTW